jgi:transposase
VARPDREVPHEPGCCGRCGAGLAGRPVTGVERRQVFDLPEVAVTVTEHQLIERECGCGHRTRAAAPRGGEAPVQYGPRVAAIIVYLYAGQFLSKERTAQALAELFGIALSSGTVAGITARAAGRLDGFLAQVRDTIAAAEVAGFDETGFRVDGRLHWVHLGSSSIPFPTDTAPSKPRSPGGSRPSSSTRRESRAAPTSVSGTARPPSTCSGWGTAESEC